MFDPSNFMTMGFNMPAMVGQIAAMVLFGKYVPSKDKEGMQKMLTAITATHNESVLNLVANWRGLAYWMNFHDSEEGQKAEQHCIEMGVYGSDEDREQSTISSALASFIEDHNGVVGLTALCQKFDEARKFQAIAAAGVMESVQPSVMEAHTADLGVIDGQQCKATLINGASQQEAHALIEKLAGHNVKFITINSADELDGMDIPQEAKDYARAMIAAGNCTMPLRLGIGPRKEASAATDLSEQEKSKLN